MSIKKSVNSRAFSFYPRTQKCSLSVEDGHSMSNFLTYAVNLGIGTVLYSSGPDRISFSSWVSYTVIKDSSLLIRTYNVYGSIT